MAPNDVALDMIGDYRRPEGDESYESAEGVLLLSRNMQREYKRLFGPHVLHHCRGGCGHGSSCGSISPGMDLASSVPMAKNLQLRSISAAIQTSLILLRDQWDPKGTKEGIIDANSNFLTYQSVKASPDNWYPLSSLSIEFPVKIQPQSSWEISLSFPNEKLIFVFIVSLLADRIDAKGDIIIHLVRKAKNIMISQFCLVGGNGYGEVQSKVEKMILNEFGPK